VETGGRVSTLITVGAGFRQELSGRENLFVGGAVLGMAQRDVVDHLEEIVEFSGLGPAIDRPVKHYSSGMYMRLGFSLAIFARPDVLLVDEVLSVGDRAFRARCDARMKEMLANGVTLVFVSHAMQMVQALCPRTLVLSKGEVVFDGPVEDGINQYHALINTPNVEMPETEFEADAGILRVLGGAEIEDLVLLDAAGAPSGSFPVGDEVTVRFRIRMERDLERPRVRLGVFSGAEPVYTVPFTPLEETVPAGDELEATARLVLNLGPGSYQLQIAVRGAEDDHLAARLRSAPFLVRARDDLQGWGVAHLDGEAVLTRAARARH
jgi:ABC-2 type transport system ATP-binding protein